MRTKHRKVDQAFTVRSFSAKAAVEKYAAAVDDVRLWESEKIFFSTHFSRSGRLLDLGCGAGRTTLWLWRGGYRNIVGADITPAMIRTARKIAKDRRIPVEFVVADARDLPFANVEFDGCLFSFNGLMQIPGRADRIRAMKEVRRVLKKGGTFVFVTHDREAARENRPFWTGEKNAGARAGTTAASTSSATWSSTRTGRAARTRSFTFPTAGRSSTASGSPASATWRTDGSRRSPRSLPTSGNSPTTAGSGRRKNADRAGTVYTIPKL